MGSRNEYILKKRKRYHNGTDRDENYVIWNKKYTGQFCGQFETAEEEISEFEDMPIENIQN